MVVLTLDAGGTNLVFNYVIDGIVGEDILTFKTKSDNLDQLLEKIVSGFEEIDAKIDKEIDAISFCFPGPADYKNGVIGDLENLPYFKGGVPLSAILEDIFNVPVYINNDGDMFTLGEYDEGFLKRVNSDLKQFGSTRRYSNLYGITLGTGFGGGVVIDGKILIGDNSAGGEINRMASHYYSGESCEELISKRGLKRVFSELTTKENITFSPKEIANIAKDPTHKYVNEAFKSYQIFGTEIGMMLANSLTLLDSPVVLGGGMSNAKDLLAKPIVEALNKKFSTISGKSVGRMEIEAINYEDPIERDKFLSTIPQMIKVPNSDRMIEYNDKKIVPIGFKSFSTSKAVSLGCYNYALRSKKISL
jgi:glucokinase